jgi:hypothetical protein
MSGILVFGLILWFLLPLLLILTVEAVVLACALLATLF